MTGPQDPPPRPGKPDDIAALAARLLAGLPDAPPDPQGPNPSAQYLASPSGHPAPPVTAVGPRMARLQDQGVTVTTGGSRARRAGARGAGRARRSHGAAMPLRGPLSSGARQRRRRERAQRRRRQGAVGTALLVVLGLVSAVGLGLLVQGQFGGPSAQTLPEARPVQVATLLSVTGPGAKGVDDITVFALSPDESEAIVVLIPPGTRVEVPGTGPAALSESIGSGGPKLLETAVANLLGIRFDAEAVITPTQLANVFRRVAPIAIDVPTRVAVSQPNGRVDVRFAAGPQRLSAEQLVDYMTFKGQGTDIDRVARQQLGWEAWLAAAGTGAGDDLSVGVGLFPVQAPLKKVFGQAGKGQRTYQFLPVEAAGVTGGSDIYQPKKEEIRALVDRTLAGAIPPAAVAGRVKVDIRNGNGGVGVSQKVAGLLVPAGYNVVIIGNADNFLHQQTEVVFYDSVFEDKARDVVRLLGVGKLVLNGFPSGVADITIIVGKDFPK